MAGSKPVKLHNRSDKPDNIVLRTHETEQKCENIQKELDRMERESIEFHRAVAEGYRSLAERFPERIEKIDATLPIDEICGIIKGRIEELIG